MKIHKIPCDSEFRTYALISQIKLILYTALHKRVSSTF